MMTDVNMDGDQVASEVADGETLSAKAKIFMTRDQLDELTKEVNEKVNKVNLVD